jgi:GNAT superfamily N-acetyltransferase
MFEVWSTDNPTDAPVDFLASRPAEHNLVLAALDRYEPSRYWCVSNGVPVGVAAVTSGRAALTPTPIEAVHALADAMAEEQLTELLGDAATVANFAGRWSTRTRLPAVPVQGQRLYRLETLLRPDGVAGTFSIATDVSLVKRWLVAFAGDAGVMGLPDDVIADRVRLGRYWLWEDGGPVSMAGGTPPVAGAARVGPVYTPAEHRGHGYAGALTAALSAALLAAGADTCVLYTDLANPTSNGVYQRIGYVAVSELVLYRLGRPD